MSSTDQTTDGWAQDFSYDYYRKLLRVLQETFDVRTLSEYPECRSSGERVAIVRHDVDVCMERAVELARLEHQVGVRSVYMVNPDTPLYDIDDERERLFEIRDLGHEIGLHCDLTSMTNDARNDELDVDRGLSRREEKHVEDARRRLESIGLDSITSLSFHRPVTRVLEGPPMITGMVNAYSSALMSAYISDSAGRWREGPPIQTIPAPAPDVLQVLTHPVWWAETHNPPLEQFLSVTNGLDILNEDVYAELVSICPEYGERIDDIVA